MAMSKTWISSSFLVFFLIFSCYSSVAQPNNIEHPTANLSTTWANNESIPNLFSETDNSTMRHILLSGTGETQYSCGFFCYKTCTRYLFAIVIIAGGVPNVGGVVWSPNRDHLVKEGAILELTSGGDLVLHDVDGSVIWSANSSGKSVVGMHLTESGELILRDVQNSSVWTSFEHPTDTLVLGQRLYEGQRLIPSISPTNWTSQNGLYGLQVTNKGLIAYIDSNPAQVYFKVTVDGDKTNKNKTYIRYSNRSFCFFVHASEPSKCDEEWLLPEPSSPQYIKLTSFGHLKVYEWKQVEWVAVKDLLGLEECRYPLTCGRNSICSANKECICSTDSFEQVNNRRPSLGCRETVPLRCNATEDQAFIEVEDVRYSPFTADMENVNVETCKQACLENCSCKAALFKYGSNSSNVSCYLPSELFTLESVDPNGSNVFALIKVQREWSAHSSSISKNHRAAIIIGATVGSVLLVGLIIYIYYKRQRNADMPAAEDAPVDQVTGMATQFSYEELRSATDNFSRKLGQGGFGSVFEGTLQDGTKIAVKCLEGPAHRSFLAEVETVGSIHHVNLVRLRGYCVHTTQRFLLYEYMVNGSLDKWIYHDNREDVLGWECRKNILLGLAKGLTYLHDECRQKIIHFDVKPQNILLDSDFNARLSDFGLSRLVDRNETHVMTTKRGTPGYTAPEFSSLTVTEKVDVYSYGIVLLEILSGRKNFVFSRPQELLEEFQSCCEQGMLQHLVDRGCEEMLSKGEEVVELMKLASWCLQLDATRRPSMASVVKVLEGDLNIEVNLEYNFTYSRIMQTRPEHDQEDITVMSSSVLSGPR